MWELNFRVLQDLPPLNARSNPILPEATTCVRVSISHTSESRVLTVHTVMLNAPKKVERLLDRTGAKVGSHSAKLICQHGPSVLI
jgi:hypothetical protein